MHTAGDTIKLSMPNFLGKKPLITITAINIRLHGYMHSIAGMDVREDSFSIEVPFRNKTHTDMLTDAASFKSQKAEPIKVKGITVADPFRLISVDPKPPIEIKADDRVVFKLVLAAPSHSYSGPLGIAFESDSAEMVHIEISGTVLEAKGVKVPIETSSRILNLPKGQIFTEKIQLYKGFSFGDTISSIEVAHPFKFVSSQPKLPLKIDNPNSYILDIHIQPPPSSYAGKLEVRIS
ncbi:MAG: hypothetical protein KGI06_04410 [Candidatus Micrarchaeota archaeon]|nr:hypothetical protein [Candidatus Micrarchaeota archaeon]